MNSITARTDYLFTYDINDLGELDPTPLVQSPYVPQVNRYEAYGEIVKEVYVKNPGYEKKAYTERMYPGATGFTNWNRKTYSEKEFDTENGNYYYGSRFYDALNGRWNKQDSYRGNTADSMSLHRYMFVNDNPVNNIDIYGFQTCGFDYFGSPCSVGTDNSSQLYSMVDQQRNFYEGEITWANDTASIYTGNVATLNQQIPGLELDMNIKWWGMYHAKIDYYDNIVMNGIIGRLEARGYEMNYATVYSYMGQRVAETGQVYSIKTQQYQIAANRYYTAVDARNYYQDMIPRLHDYANFMQSESEGFEFWVDGVSYAYYQNEKDGFNSFFNNYEDYYKKGNTPNLEGEKSNSYNMNVKGQNGEEHSINLENGFIYYLGHFFLDETGTFNKDNATGFFNGVFNEAFNSGDNQAQIWNANYSLGLDYRTKEDDLADGACLVPVVETGCDIIAVFGGKELDGDDAGGLDRGLSTVALILPVSGKSLGYVGDFLGIAKKVDNLPTNQVDNLADDLFDSIKGSDNIPTRPRVNRVTPDPTAIGPHSTFNVDPNTGLVNKYSTWTTNPQNPTGFDLVKRFDGTGGAHNGVPTPHIHDGKIVRLPEDWELPSGY